MSIFGKIASAIFGGAAHAAPVTDDVIADVKASSPMAAAAAKAAAPIAAATAASPAATSAATAASKTTVDVAAVLDEIADGSDEGDLDWRKSIVDLMKLLDIDSSLTARRELATELHYGGDMKDSAAMNVWLHKQVMTKLAENGGKVPSELKH